MRKLMEVCLDKQTDRQTDKGLLGNRRWKYFETVGLIEK